MRQAIKNLKNWITKANIVGSSLKENMTAKLTTEVGIVKIMTQTAHSPWRGEEVFKENNAIVPNVT